VKDRREPPARYSNVAVPGIVIRTSPGSPPTALTAADDDGGTHPMPANVGAVGLATPAAETPPPTTPLSVKHSRSRGAMQVWISHVAHGQLESSVHGAPWFGPPMHTLDTAQSASTTQPRYVACGPQKPSAGPAAQTPSFVESPSGGVLGVQTPLLQSFGRD
jgi:hypothetical protein